MSNQELPYERASSFKISFGRAGLLHGPAAPAAAGCWLLLFMLPGRMFAPAGGRGFFAHSEFVCDDHSLALLAFSLLTSNRKPQRARPADLLCFGRLESLVPLQGGESSWIRGKVHAHKERAHQRDHEEHRTEGERSIPGAEQARHQAGDWRKTCIKSS
jgi:hypothetical protein